MYYVASYGQKTLTLIFMRIVLQHELRDVEGCERVPAQRGRVRADYRHHLTSECMQEPAEPAKFPHGGGLPDE